MLSEKNLGLGPTSPCNKRWMRKMVLQWCPLGVAKSTKHFKSLQGPSRLVKNSPNLDVKVPPNLLRSSNRKQTFTNWVRDCVWKLLSSALEFNTHYGLSGNKSRHGARAGPLMLPHGHWAYFQRRHCRHSAKGLGSHRAALWPAPHSQAPAARVGAGDKVPWIRCCLLGRRIKEK